MESDPHAWEELHRLIAKGFVTKVDTLAECRRHLSGEEPVVSKFGMIEKKRDGVVLSLIPI